jgi:hypothetical protein
VSLQVGTGKAGQADELLEALARGRNDHQFFSQWFMGRTLHDGQLEFCTNANATINALATSNRWGKTTVLPEMHFHSGIYKTGAEHRYLDDAGDIDIDKFIRLKYETVHTAGEWELAALVWNEMHKLVAENPRLDAFISAAPKSLPPHFDFISGARAMIRTLGVNASGIDGKSIYLLSIDEAGWIPGLLEMMSNVLRIRVGDVQGRIVIVGTFKPGVSRDFYKVCVRASAYTGRAIGFDHRSEIDDSVVNDGLDSSIRKCLREFGINLDEYADALKGR